MNFDFSTAPERRSTHAIKWSRAAEGELPLWVADMDFPVAPAIQEAILARAAHPIYGYTDVPATLYTAVSAWLSDRHRWSIAPEALMTVPGVLPALVVALDISTAPGDGVVVPTPVYAPFFRAVEGNGRRVCRVPLVVAEQNGRPAYRLDEARLRAAAVEARALLLCSPHNPGGRVWTAVELALLAQIAQEFDLTIIADEIHGDLTYPDAPFVPMAGIAGAAERTVALFAPSKTFNIPGLATAICAVPDPVLRRRFRRAAHARMLEANNPLSLAAVEAAYRFGGPWLDQARQYIAANYHHLTARLEAELPAARVYHQEGTFIVWVDLAGCAQATAALGDRQTLAVRFVAHARAAGVWVSDGLQYGAEGATHVRINVGCPRSTLNAAIDRLVAAAHTFSW